MYPDVYKKLTDMSDDKDMTVKEALNELVDKSINSEGKIVVNELEAKMNN